MNPTKRLALAVVLVSLWLAPSFSQERDKAEKDLERVPLDAADLPSDLEGVLALWGKKLGAHVAIDQQLAGMRIDVRPGMSWGAFKELLSMRDVVMEHKQVRDAWILFAHARYNLRRHIAPPFRVIGPGEALDRRDEIVTALVAVKNGGGAEIVATVRGLAAQDVNQIGTILHVPGADVVLIVDFASKVDYYRRCIAQLDEATVPFETRVFQLLHAPVDDVAPLVRGLLQDGRGAAGQKILPEPRTNRLVVKAYRPQLAEVSALLTQLDVAVVRSGAR